jgi:hypothetical protein
VLLKAGAVSSALRVASECELEGLDFSQPGEVLR